MRDLSLAYDRSSDDGQASAARSIPRGRNIRLFSDVRWSVLLHSLEKNESLVGPLISRVNTRTYGNGMSLAYGSPMGGTTGGFCSVRTITLESAAERARRALAPTHIFLGASGAARLSSLQCGSASRSRSASSLERAAERPRSVLVSPKPCTRP